MVLLNKLRPLAGPAVSWLVLGAAFKLAGFCIRQYYALGRTERKAVYSAALRARCAARGC